MTDRTKTEADPLKDALLRFYNASLAEWAGASRQRRAAVLTASDEVHKLLYPGEPIGGMPLGGQSL